MTTITLQFSKVYDTLVEAYDHMGDSDRNVYVTTSGSIELRHNSQNNIGWYKVMGCYYLPNAFYSGVDGVTREDVLDAVKYDIREMQTDWTIEVFDDNGNSNDYTFELI